LVVSHGRSALRECSLIYPPLALRALCFVDDAQLALAMQNLALLNMHFDQVRAQIMDLHELKKPLTADGWPSE
jgi:hypothetical protein